MSARTFGRRRRGTCNARDPGITATRWLCRATAASALERLRHGARRASTSSGPVRASWRLRLPRPASASTRGLPLLSSRGSARPRTYPSASRFVQQDRHVGRHRTPALPRDAVVSVGPNETPELDDDQQSHRCQEITARTRRSGSLRPAPEQRSRLQRKRATMSMPWLLLSATAVGQKQPRQGRARARRAGNSRSFGMAPGAPNRRDRRAAVVVVRAASAAMTKRSPPPAWNESDGP